MARNDLAKPGAGDWPLTNPWPPLIVGLVAGVLGVLLAGWSGTAGVLVRLAVVGVAVLSGAAAVSLRLHFAGWELEDRAKSAGIVALGAVIAVLAFAGLDPDWDSARLVLAVVTGVALAGAVLILLPTAVRKVVLVLLVLVHFGGIFCAVTSVPPPNAPAPWLTTTAWTYFYRPYLQFLYLNNAYHFYSPDPGPPTLLWFHIDYKGGSERWVRLPERDQFHTKQEYQRRLALTESTNQLMSSPPEFVLNNYAAERQRAGNLYHIPIHPELSAAFQFHEPNAYSKHMIAAYARHVAYAYKSETDPGAEVEGVKVYRVVHSILTAEQMDAGQRPTDPTTNLPYYQGEFDKEGNLKNPKDPFLYWLIPIMWVPKEPGAGIIRLQPKPDPERYEIHDYTKDHAAIPTRKP
jgi:hypothetical protein